MEPNQSLQISQFVYMARCDKRRHRLTLLAAQQPLHALDQFVSVAVRVDPDLLQLLVTHVGEHVQGDLEDGDFRTHTHTHLWHN